MNAQVKAILAELRNYLETLYGDRLNKILLYGSQARGDARPDSDIDVLIVLKEPFNYSQETEKISFITSPLCLQHNVAISCTFVTPEQFQQGNNGFWCNVRCESITI